MGVQLSAINAKLRVSARLRKEKIL